VILKKLKLRQKDLLAIGYPKGKAIGIAINVAIKYCKKQTKEAVLTQLKAVLDNPEQFQKDPVFGKITDELLETEEAFLKEEIEIAVEPKPYKAYGLQHIEAGTLLQMDTAMRLPVTVKGALMPDAHQGKVKLGNKSVLLVQEIIL